jgi:hypothetical protein
MSTSVVNKLTGELVTTASGTRYWVGTRDAYNAAKLNGSIPGNTMVCITDDGGQETITGTATPNADYISSGTISYVRYGKIAMVKFTGVVFVDNPSLPGNVTVATGLPRPAADFTFALTAVEAESSKHQHLTLRNDTSKGLEAIGGYTQGNAAFYGSATYLCD